MRHSSRSHSALFSVRGISGPLGDITLRLATWVSARFSLANWLYGLSYTSWQLAVFYRYSIRASLDFSLASGQWARQKVFVIGRLLLVVSVAINVRRGTNSCGRTLFIRQFA
jgi:hypothetical protein